MDVREKLVELLQNAKAAMKSENLSCDIARNMFVVDFMMANGVTVQEWISVEDRLPEEDGYYLCCIKSSLFPDRVYIDILECDKGSFEEGHIYTDTVTHWMPMPQPPKGE